MYFIFFLVADLLDKILLGYKDLTEKKNISKLAYKFEVSTSSQDALTETKFILPKQLETRQKFRNQTSGNIGKG